MEVRRVELLSKVTSPFIPTCVSFVFNVSPVSTPKKVGANPSQPRESRDAPPGMTNPYPILRPGSNPHGRGTRPGVAAN